MEKLDLKKKYKDLYKPSAKQVVVVDVPEFKFVMVDGVIPAGTPVAEAEDFVNAMTVLYGLSYTLKFASKLRKENPIDYTVMALEGLWWVKGGEFKFGKVEPWYFTAIMMQPEHITQEMYQEAVAEFKRKKGDNPALAKLRFEPFHEGLSVQVMHLGPYSEEPATIARMDAYAEENGYKMRGKHHEIYLGDPRRGDPAKTKTVLRHAVEKK
jgi:hypothetical protein